MPFVLSFFISLMGYFLPFIALAELTCDCEKIIREQECDNPDCIKICNLQSVFRSTGKLLEGKCMEKLKKEDFKTEENFPLEKVMGTDVRGFLNAKTKKIKETDQKNEGILKKSCPGCHLSSKVDAKIIPRQKEQRCDEYVETEEYKAWRNKMLEDKTFCTPKTRQEGRQTVRVKMNKEQEKLCGLSDKYEYCCAKQYLKTHKYSHRIKVEFGENKVCEKEQVKEINKNANKYVDSIIGENDNELSRKLWSECPNGCSFTVNRITKINKSGCYGDVDLKVICTHKRKTNWARNPVYNISVDYKGDIQCQ